METIANNQTEAAKKLLSEGKRKQALICIKRKRYQEQMLVKAEALLNNIEEMIGSLEFSKLQLDVVESLKQGNSLLKSLQSQMDLDDIEQLMLDTKESHAYQDQIDSALGAQLSQEDDAAIEAEFQQLLASELQPLPEVPSHSLPAVSTPPPTPIQSTSQPQLSHPNDPVLELAS